MVNVLSAPATRIRCRRMTGDDLDAAVDLLSAGFPERPRDYWVAALERLGRRTAPPGEAGPRYGFVLQFGERLVGILLTIVAPDPSGAGTRCNLSSWFVEPEFRSYALLLDAAATRDRAATYVNVSPAPHTWPLIETLGYRRYSEGIVLSCPWLAAKPAEPVRILPGRLAPERPYRPGEAELLADHADYGCVAVWAVTAGEAHPFVFAPRRFLKNLIPCAHLAYCRSHEDLARFARPLGRHLLRLGYPMLVVDANAPVPGIAGRYTDRGTPKYVRGPAPVRLGDLAHTEAAMFGF